ncbi:hypothetical protein LS684_18665 [Cytobacillus spongiae]|uniref:hypothetical protein n=1 Tax=Cytobacillus spongiae TaxID=2901381 RepID=UPI001F2975A5|nr:hypothetical protein [Cytobacillus spongiae]UII55623.1 hypothetical protein LS684_18665 [Cytobacillus spongiae]
MQINQQTFTTNNTQTTNQPLELKEGEIYRAQIKERVSDSEAVLVIRGKELPVKFEGAVPSQSPVTVQISGQKDQATLVKAIASESIKAEVQSTNAAKAFQSIGINSSDSPEIKKAAQVLLDKGLPLSKEVVEELKSFFNKAKGSEESKIDTVKALANKKLEVTQVHLKAIHEALHGDRLSDVLKNIAKELDPNFKIEGSNQNQYVNHSSKSIENNASTSTTKVLRSESNSLNLPQNDAVNKQVRDALSNLRQVVENEPNLKEAVRKVKEEVWKMPGLDKESIAKIEKAANEAEKLQSIGKERLLQELRKAENHLEWKNNQQPEKITQIQPNKSAIESLSTIVNEIKSDLVKSSNLQKAMDRVQVQLVRDSRFPQQSITKVQQTVEEVASLQKQGRITAGKEQLGSVLNSLENELKSIEMSRANKNLQTIEQKPSEIVKQAKETVQQDPDLSKAIEKVREQVVTNPKIDREVAQKVEKAVQEARQLQQIGRETVGRERLTQALTKAENELGKMEASSKQQQAPAAEQRPSEIIKQAKETVQQEPDLSKAIEKVREQVVTNPKIDREVAQKVEKAPQEARQLQQMGRETVGRERLTQALTQVENELGKMEASPKQQAPATEQRPSEIIKQAKETVQQEPDLSKAIEKVREQVVTNPKIDREVAQKVEKALQEARQLQQVGRETVGRERLTQALTQADMELTKTEAQGKPQAVEAQLNDTARNTTEATKATTATDELKETVKHIRNELQSKEDVKASVKKILDEITSSRKLDPVLANNLEKMAKQANQLNDAGRERIANMLKQVQESLGLSQQKVDPTKSQDSVEMNPEQQMKQGKAVLPSETIKQAIKQLQNEPSLDVALDTIRKQISSNPNIDLKNIEKAENSLERAAQLQEKGREMAARQEISKTLTEMEQDLTKTEPASKSEPTSAAENYDINEKLQGLNVPSKDILVTRVTQKLAQVTHDFRELKREITRNLDHVDKLIQTFKNNAYPQAKQMLESAISKLDNAILKSDIMLFTDMQTEKKLINASSQLAEAKKLLAKGEHSQASKIVQEVKTLVDKINFKPTDQKIVHYASKESLMLENSKPSHQLLNHYGDLTKNISTQEPSAKQMFEAVRTLGLNHESDLGKSLVFQKGDSSFQQEQSQQQQNMKAALMKLAQGEGEETSPKVMQQAEQALNNLTGQQLLSKSDASGSLQSMFFNLPMLLGGKPENIQVFINSKNEGEQVDWENCSIYFLLETNKLGDVGVMLTSSERNLSITIKNDKPGFKEKMEPIAAIAKEKLNEIGYSVNSISFAKMNAPTTNTQEEQPNHAAAKPLRPVFTEKGMDFKI